MTAPTRAELAPYEADPARLRETFASFPSGVVALLAHVDGENHAMVASAFTVGVSWDPPLVSCAIQNISTTWQVLRRADRIGVSVLGEDHGPLARRLSGRDKSARFSDAPLREIGSSALFIAGAPSWFECALAGEFPAGDHTVALLEVKALGAEPSGRPLIFHGSTFRQLQLDAADLNPT